MKHKLLHRTMLLLAVLASLQKGQAQLVFDKTFHVALDPTWVTTFKTSVLKDGNLWCVGTEGTYSFYNGSVWTKSKIPNATSSNRGIALDHQSTLWIGSFGDGLFKKEGNTWTQFTESNSELPSDNIRALLYDTIHQELWVATYGGLVRIKNNVWDIFTEANSQLESGLISDIEQSADGAIWVVNDSRLVKIHNGAWTVFTSSQIFGGSDDDLADVFIDHNQNVWTTSSYSAKGAASFDGDNWTVLPGFSGKVLQSVGVDMAGTVFLGELFKGMHVVFGGINYYFPSSPDGFPTSQNFNFTLDKNSNSLWLSNTWGLWEIKSATVSSSQPNGPGNSLMAFPVPAYDKISITSEKSFITSIQVTNVHGVLVETLRYNNESTVELPVGHLPAGVYFLQTTLKDNRIEVIQVVVNSQR